MNKEIVGIEISHNSNSTNIFITFLPHEYQHINIPRDHSIELWKNEAGVWEITKNKETARL